MAIPENVLSAEERAVFKLRALYEQYGFKKYRMSKFEEYDLYAENKNFLANGNIITFTDLNGKLLALKPDVTLSIAKHMASGGATAEKVYYNENVYRTAPGGSEYREIMQTGVESIGEINLRDVSEMVVLAAKSLSLLSNDYIVDVAHLGLVAGLLAETGLGTADKERLAGYISQKNAHQISGLCAKRQVEAKISAALAGLAAIYGPFDQALRQARALDVNEQTHTALAELEEIYRELGHNGCAGRVRLDFSFVNNMNYYEGVIFQGFIQGVCQPVLSGGSYGKLLRKLGKQAGAIGFAVYLNLLEAAALARDATERQPVCCGALGKTIIDIALPKGRLGEKAFAIFERAGYTCPAMHESNRKLLFENEELGVRYFWAKPSDVAVYVERGAADLGVAGKDILEEYRPDLYELLDLQLGRCRMVVAGARDFQDDPGRTLRVATKFPNIARDYYRRHSRDVEIIMLNGSIELAPILNMSDVIVDIVETGVTLRENDLAPLAEISQISARLIANKASYKFKYREIERLKAALAALLAE